MWYFTVLGSTALNIIAIRFHRHTRGTEQRKKKLAVQLQEMVLPKGWSAPGSDAKTPPKLLGQVYTLVQSKQNH